MRVFGILETIICRFSSVSLPICYRLGFSKHFHHISDGLYDVFRIAGSWNESLDAVKSAASAAAGVSVAGPGSPGYQALDPEDTDTPGGIS